MPSVGMRRSTRVFVPKMGVKDVDEAKVLRSGRRLWLESGEGNRRGGTDGHEWFHIIDNNSNYGGDHVLRCKENGWHGVDVKKEVAVAAAMDIDGEIAGPKSVNCAPSGFAENNDVDSMWGIVYQRKRKRVALKGFGLSVNSENEMDLEDRMYGIQFVRKQRRKENRVAVADACGSEVGFAGRGVSGGYVLRGMLSIVVESSYSSSSCWITRFLNSVLSYMRRADVRLTGLSAFMLLEPITSAFSSHGIHVLRDPPSCHSSGMCKIFGANCFMPLFAVDFSAVPVCFMYLHSSMLLRSACLSNVLVMSSMGMHTKSKIMVDRNGRLPCIPSEIDLSGSKPVASGNDNSGKRNLLYTTGVAPKLAGRNPKSRNSLNSRITQKRRSSLRSGRARNPSLVGLHKANGGLVSDSISIRNDGIPFSSVVSNRRVTRSVQSSSTRNIKEVKSTLVGLIQDIDSTCCYADILVFESDKCYREKGATVMLEISASKQWFLAVKKDGSTRYSFKPQKTISCASNRFTHAIIWTGENGWKLEFPNRQDWLIFKELYRECCDRNVLAPTVKIIPVPGVHEVSGYGDSDSAPFLRPDSYITLNADEVSRAMSKRTANYDMDSEDEEWLKKFNDEFCAEELHEHVSEENFELMVDTFEKAFYCSPDDFSDDKAAANLCLDLGRREVIEAVYSYWMKKRKQKRSALVRVFQCYQPRRAQVIPKRVLRKRRSFKRQASQVGRGKRRSVLQENLNRYNNGWTVIATEQDALEEQNAQLRVQEAKVSANRSEELAVLKRQRAQLLTENADLVAYKATIALRIAEAARVADSLDAAAEYFLG